MTALVYGVGAFILIYTFVILYFFFSITTALTIYSSVRLYPIGLGIAEWVTVRRNLLPFVLFMLLTIAITVILLVGAYIFALNVHWVGYLLIALLILLLAVVAIIFDGAMMLAIIMWIVRLSHWAFAGFRKALWRAIHGKTVPDRVKPSYRGRQRRVRQRVEGPYPLVPSTEEKARQKAKAEARAKAQAKAKAIEKAMARAQAKAQAIEKQRAKELAKAQAIHKARAKALAEAQAIAKGKAGPKKTRSEKTSKPKPRAQAIAKGKAEAKKTRSEETSKPKPRRRRRPRPGPRPG